MRDNIPGSRNAYPKTAYAVIGSQADRPSKNQLTVIKLSNMHKTKRRAKKDEDEEGNDSEDDEDDDADSDEVRHPYTCHRQATVFMFQHSFQGQHLFPFSSLFFRRPADISQPPRP